jgi:hypothetical protein
VRLHAGEKGLRARFAQPPFPAWDDAGLLRKLIKFGEVFRRRFALQTKLCERLAIARKPAVRTDARLIQIA